MYSRLFLIRFLLLSHGIFNTVLAQSTNLNKQSVLSFINHLRVSGCQCGYQYYPSVPTVKWNDTLARIALRHSLDMVNNEYFSHEDLKGRDVNFRSEQMGYYAVVIGENLAQGYNNTDAVMQAWMKSPAHCKIMMISDFNEIGVGVVGAIWTMVLGTRKDPSKKYILNKAER